MTMEPVTGLRQRLLQSYLTGPISDEEFFSGCPGKEQVSFLLENSSFFFILSHHMEIYIWPTCYAVSCSLVHLSQRLKCTIVITGCPSVCLSVRPSSVCCLLFTFSTSPLKPLNRIQQNLTGSKIPTPFTEFVFFRLIGKTRWPPWPLIGWDIFDLSSETAEQNSTKLDRKQDLNILTKFVFFRPIRKTRWPPWPLIGWDIFDFSFETAEWNLTKLNRKQDLNILYQVCVFRADRKNKMAALASDWRIHFRLLFWNRWTEFNETWQETRSQYPLPSLCFFGRLGKQDGCPGLWLAETFSTSPLKLLNGIQQNLTRRKISTSSTKFVFFGPIGKTRWPPWPLICWDIFDFCSETAERNSTKLDRKLDLNILYQVCIFQANRKNKMAALASS